MPGGKDIPDWGGTYTNTFFQPLFDDGELAARLGSLVTFDRRGAVVFVDDFNYGLGGWSFHDATGTGSFNLSVAKWHHPPFAGLLTTGINQNDESYVRRPMAFPGSPRLGFAFLINAATNFHRLRWVIDLYIDGDWYQVYLALGESVSGQLTLTHSSATTTLDTSPNFINGSDAFNFVKIVVDTSTLIIPRVIVNDTEYDTSAYSLKDLSISGTALINVSVYSKNNRTDSVAQSTYIDSVILTAVEP